MLKVKFGDRNLFPVFKGWQIVFCGLLTIRNDVRQEFGGLVNILMNEINAFIHQVNKVERHKFQLGKWAITQHS